MIEIKVDTAAYLAQLKNVQTNQIPFAMKTAINDTVLQAQRVQVAHDRQVFTQRRGSWQERAIKVTHFASKAEPWAIIGVHAPGDESRTDVLWKFEDETEKRPFRGHTVAVPTSFIKRSKADIIPTRLRPSQLNLHRDGNRVVGDQRTFLAKLPGGRSVIVQRIGRGARSMTAAIWQLVPFVRITPDLDFEPNVRATVERGWARNFAAAWAKATATAR